MQEIIELKKQTLQFYFFQQFSFYFGTAFVIAALFRLKFDSIDIAFIFIIVFIYSKYKMKEKREQVRILTGE